MSCIPVREDNPKILKIILYSFQFKFKKSKNLMLLKNMVDRWSEEIANVTNTTDEFLEQCSSDERNNEKLCTLTLVKLLWA